jgi:excisionase family DNA binding protein
MRDRKPHVPYTPAEIEAIKHKAVLTPREAAILAGISNSTIYVEWQNGTGPQSFKIGKCRRLRREALDAWIASREAQK